MEGEMPGGSGELPLVCGYSDEMLTDLQECVWDRTRDTGHGIPPPARACTHAHTHTHTQRAGCLEAREEVDRVGEEIGKMVGEGLPLAFWPL